MKNVERHFKQKVKMNQENQNLLKKNFQEWAIFSIINNTKLNDRPVVGWKIIANKKVTVEARMHIIRKFRDEIVIRAVGDKGKNDLVNLTASEAKLNFYLPDDLVLFQTDVRKIENNGDLVVKMPKMIAQVDRRKDLRLFVEDAMAVDLEFKKSSHSQKSTTQFFKKRCFDISAGGCSFIISKMEKKFFNIGDQIGKFQLKLGKKKIIMQCEVVNMFEEKPNNRNGLVYQGWKVCVKHRYVAPNDKKTVEEFVFRYVDFSAVI